MKDQMENNLHRPMRGPTMSRRDISGQAISRVWCRQSSLMIVLLTMSSSPYPALASNTNLSQFTSHQTTNHRQASSSLAEVPQVGEAVNLIPVDQPLGSPSSSAQPQRQSADSLEVETLDQSNGSVASEPPGEASLQASDGDQQRSKSQDTAAIQQAIDEALMRQPAPNNQLEQQQRPSPVERRFGLLKKQHYGAPASMMSASYVASPASYLMSDCERCLASLGVGPSSGVQQPSADLQQVEPIPVIPVTPSVAPTIPANVQPISHVQPPSYGHQVSYGPLKSKLFMKFPFFMKSNQQSYNQLDQQSAYLTADPQVNFWSQFRPQANQQSGALYLRPSGGYNCVQASAPLMALHAGPPHELAPTKGQLKQYAGPNGNGHHHQAQQQTYPASSY